MSPLPFPSLELYIYQRVETRLDPLIPLAVYHFIKLRQIFKYGFVRCCSRTLRL